MIAQPPRYLNFPAVMSLWYDCLSITFRHGTCPTRVQSRSGTCRRLPGHLSHFACATCLRSVIREAVEGGLRAHEKGNLAHFAVGIDPSFGLTHQG